jgi:hypothetical protein
MIKYIELAKKIIEEEFSVVGIRSAYDDETYEAGDTCRESYEWDLAEDCSTYHTTGLTAGGTCATEVNVDFDYYTTEDHAKELAEKIESAVNQNKSYLGDYQYIVGGYSRNTDYDLSDDNEVRIVDAEVIDKL